MPLSDNRHNGTQTFAVQRFLVLIPIREIRCTVLSTQAGWSYCASELYPGGAGFESRCGHRQRWDSFPVLSRALYTSMQPFDSIDSGDKQTGKLKGNCWPVRSLSVLRSSLFTLGPEADILPGFLWPQLIGTCVYTRCWATTAKQATRHQLLGSGSRSTTEGRCFLWVLVTQQQRNRWKRSFLCGPCTDYIRSADAITRVFLREYWLLRFLYQNVQ
jgi:hypothetical protein